MLVVFSSSFGIAPIAVRLNQIKGLFNRSLEATVTDHYEFLGLAVSLASKLNLNISHSLTAMALPQKKPLGQIISGYLAGPRAQGYGGTGLLGEAHVGRGCAG